jgi:hypothetical protein
MLDSISGSNDKGYGLLPDWQGMRLLPESAKSLDGRAEDYAMSNIPGLKVLNKTLLEGLGSASALSKWAKAEPPTSEEVAANVLGFISRNLQRAQSAGASQSKLEHILTESIKGMEQGYDQAMQDLKQLGLLPNDELSTELNKTHELLQAGTEDLRQQFIKPASSSNVIPFPGQVSAATQNTALHAENIDLQIQTQEGDTVTISVSKNTAQYQQAQFAANANGISAQYSSETIQNSYLSYSVKGDLNKDERAAIDDLVKQVNDLSNEFFNNGDAEAVLQHALSLGLNNDEISQFSLQLSELDVRQVTNVYHEVASLGDDNQPHQNYTIPDISRGIQTLGDYARGLLETLDTASTFKNPVKLLADLLGQLMQDKNKLDDKTPIVSEYAPNLLTDFTDHLLNRMA